MAGLETSSCGTEGDSWLMPALSLIPVKWKPPTHASSSSTTLAGRIWVLSWRREGGLRARLAVACPDPPAELAGRFGIGGFLEPSPKWLDQSPYFHDVGMQMLSEYVGDVLLRIAVPLDFPGLYVADFGHILEVKYHDRRGRYPLGLGYDCRTGHECHQAYVNLYVPLDAYVGGHVAPIVEETRDGPGLVIPSQFIEVWDDEREA